MMREKKGSGAKRWTKGKKLKWEKHSSEKSWLYVGRTFHVNYT